MRQKTVAHSTWQIRMGTATKPHTHKCTQRICTNHASCLRCWFSNDLFLRHEEVFRLPRSTTKIIQFAPSVVAIHTIHVHTMNIGSILMHYHKQGSAHYYLNSPPSGQQDVTTTLACIADSIKTNPQSLTLTGSDVANTGSCVWIVPVPVGR